MDLELEEITFAEFETNQDGLTDLINAIWTNEISKTVAKISLNKYFDENESGFYYYILQNRKPMGLTGYWKIKHEPNLFGLRHHGTLVKGTGKEALELLTAKIRENHPSEEKYSLMELVPDNENTNQIIKTFERWSFKIKKNFVPEWQRDKNYYKHSMYYNF